MLTELCGYLKNWFEVEKCYGNFVIADNSISFADGTALPLQEGQHFRIIGKTAHNDGAIFNSGVHQFSEEGITPALKDETWTGSVWCLAIPDEVLALSEEIAAWRGKYEGADSAMMSPFSSESFGGYSYSKAVGNTSGDSFANGWQSTFANRLSRYRKV